METTEDGRDRIVPRDSGVLAKQRYPAGTVVAWMAERLPSVGDRGWRDVARVLGLEEWHWWQGSDRRLYDGAPLADGTLRKEGGHTLVLECPTASVDLRGFNGAESFLCRNLQVELTDSDWLPLLLLHEATITLSDRAGELRRLLNRRIASRFKSLRLLRLGSFVAKVNFCQYQLQRVRQAVGNEPDQFWPVGVPGMDYVSALPMPRQRRWEAWRIWRRPQASMTRRFREVLLEALQRYLREGLDDVGLSLDRARLVSEIRASNALLTWTAALVALTVVLALLTAILVIHDLGLLQMN